MKEDIKNLKKAMILINNIIEAQDKKINQLDSLEVKLSHFFKQDEIIKRIDAIEQRINKLEDK